MSNSLWSLVLLGVFFSVKDFSALGDENSRRPIWNIAHMVNARYQIDYYLNMGANSIEFDIAFDGEGNPQFTFHGIPCDCFRNCIQYEYFIPYIEYLRQLTTPGDRLFRKELVLLFMDFKVKGLSPAALTNAGVDVAKKLLAYYWKGNTGGKAYILISLPSVNNIGFIKSFRKTLELENVSNYNSKIGYDFSGNEDLNYIRSGLEAAGISDSIWQGDGITNCLPRGTGRLMQALNRRDDGPQTYIDKVYWWTVDRMSTMRRVLSLGVDGMITNYPQNLARVLKEETYAKQMRLATLEDDPWQTYPRKTAALMSQNFTRNEYFEAQELLYNI
ncbi:dermonecrotic toxin SpeSicTox-betaIIA2i [Caerostris darwini]|uniref:Dermonecrotic toxin SpeSicTox-betaIIA2i n=1 Tax=Caerostris darwini TaxID=1538125 RepID=A0AAV4X9I0_9ARAC|nr:dermonecrotic toxin SpeSicTox-betaIIA2i [Caerostris darwini]